MGEHCCCCCCCCWCCCCCCCSCCPSWAQLGGPRAIVGPWGGPHPLSYVAFPWDWCVGIWVWMHGGSMANRWMVPCVLKTYEKCYNTYISSSLCNSKLEIYRCMDIVQCGMPRIIRGPAAKFALVEMRCGAKDCNRRLRNNCAIFH
jgi:hypothetical protein